VRPSCRERRINGNRYQRHSFFYFLFASGGYMDSGERAPTADESECIRRFCLDVSECKEHVEEARSHKHQLMQRRKDLAGVL